MNDQIFAFMIAFNVMFGFAFLDSSFVIFIVKERINGKCHVVSLLDIKLWPVCADK